MWTIVWPFVRKNWVVFVVGLILTLASARLGYRLGEASVRCPRVVAGATVVDTVLVHDTTVLRVERFKTRDVPVEIYVRDQVTDEVVVQLDTSRCYSMDTTIDGAFLSAEVCSRFFPAKRPLDLTGTLLYRPRADTMRVRVDTVTFHRPFFKEPRNYLIAGLVLTIGAGTYLYYKR